MVPDHTKHDNPLAYPQSVGVRLSVPESGLPNAIHTTVEQPGSLARRIAEIETTPLFKLVVYSGYAFNCGS